MNEGKKGKERERDRKRKREKEIEKERDTKRGRERAKNLKVHDALLDSCACGTLPQALSSVIVLHASP